MSYLWKKRFVPFQQLLQATETETKMPPAEQSQTRLCRKRFAALTGSYGFHG